MTALGERQLVFELGARPAFGLDDFLVSPCNEAALAQIDSWPDWPDPTLLLVGPHGSGKSHLATIWARAARARVLSPLDLGMARVARGEPILVEDADRIGDEATLFHLINGVSEADGTLLLTAARPPETWPVRLPDLLSRLRRASRAELGAPDEDLVRAVLVKLLIDRQLFVDTSVVEFLARHIDRTLGTAREAVRRLDSEALSGGRRITRGLAGDVLRAMESEGAQ